MSSKPPFFLVWCEGGGSPTVAHPTLHTAVREARRLAELHPGHRFTVMVAVQGFEKVQVNTIDYLGFDRSLDEIPF